MRCSGLVVLGGHRTRCACDDQASKQQFHAAGQRLGGVFPRAADPQHRARAPQSATRHVATNLMTSRELTLQYVASSCASRLDQI
eukprot:2053581-Heterocapsa_arctica.AAC.1